MRSSSSALVGLSLMLAIASIAGADDDTGFVSLFDGKTLSGWTVKCLPKDRELAKMAWSVDRGTILANTIGHKDHFYIMLVSDKEYVLNGVTVVDYDGAGVLNDAAHKQRGVGLRGSIGLQIHMNDELELRFRDLRIKERLR